MLTTGQPAPDFELPDADMTTVRLTDYRGKTVVLYFYPKDDSPSCTVEAIEFSDLAKKFDKANAVVLGVSLDDCMKHEAFRDKHGLLVRLLADADREVAPLYGALHQWEKDGMVRYSITRSTFIVDQQGVLRHALYNVTPRGHAAEVLSLIQQL